MKYEYDVSFCFNSFIVITSVYCENEDQAEISAIDKLAENGFDIRDYGRYEMTLEIMEELV
jgi:hypothetical protein